MFWGGICIVFDQLVSVDACFSFFGSQDWCKTAPQKLQLKLTLLLITTGVAGTGCVFSGAMKQEITGTFSAVSFRGKGSELSAHKLHEQYSSACFTLEKKGLSTAAGSAVYSLEHAVLKVKDNVLFIREVGVLEVMYIVNTIHPNQDRNRNVWAVLWSKTSNISTC